MQLRARLRRRGERLRREGEPAGAAEPGHPHRDGQARGRQRRRSTRVGTVQFDERLNVAVQTRVAGYLERLAVRAPMERVAKGQALATVFAPEWLGPLNEIVALKRAGVSAGAAGCRPRTHCARCPSRRSWCARARRAARPRLGTRSVAPVRRRRGRAGRARRRGRLAGHDAVPHRRPGEGLGGGRGAGGAGGAPDARARRSRRCFQADASQTFNGEMKEILPQVNAQHAHAAGPLRGRQQGRQARCPGCCCACRWPARRASRLVVPSEAVIRTGTRAVAIVRKDNGSFEPREVEARRGPGRRPRGDARADRRRPGGRQRPVPGRLGGAPALGARQHGGARRPRRRVIGRCAVRRPRRRRARSKASRPTASPSRTVRLPS